MWMGYKEFYTIYKRYVKILSKLRELPVNLTRNYSRFRTICSNYDIIGKNERINLNCIANSQINQICLLSANQKESFS